MASVLYIIGSGRSGSTVLERVLNTSPDCVAVGEVHALWRLPVQDLKCSCGLSLSNCGFWTKVLRSAGFDAVVLADLAKLERSVVRHSFLARHRFQLRKVAEHPEVLRFNTLQTQLFNAIRKISGKSTVLDSSKAGPRAWILSAGDQSLELLHLRRSARDVVTSWRVPKFEPATGQMMKKPSIFAAAIDWAKVEHSASHLAKSKSIARMSYHSFASQPRSALTNNLPSLADTVAWKNEMTVAQTAPYHSVLGNPDRYQSGDIVISPRAVSIEKLGWAERRVVAWIAAGLERLYP